MPPTSPSEADRPPRRLLLGLVTAGLVLAVVPTFMAAFTVCGISGCSGGGFGRSTDPTTTLALLAVAGLVAGAPLAVQGLRRRSSRLLGAAAALALVVSATAGWAVGSDLRGCPRNVDHGTCLEERGP